ncbi:MAG: GNAT family N-acetyltransferase [Spirochaetaceae bacterium]|nr:GNAT family N-acetyltransferase [Spirochaetaceae bacterium]
MPKIEVRRMLPAELAPAADLYLRSITGLLQGILKPEQIRADHEYRRYFTNVVARDLELWVAVRRGRRVGVMAMANEWIDQLYVDPPEQRGGAGSALLAQAKALSPHGLRVLTLQRNAVACRFYERRGFAAYDHGVSPPPENEPDVSYLWRPNQNSSAGTGTR